jgi:hypothetical protein
MDKKDPEKMMMTSGSVQRTFSELAEAQTRSSSVSAGVQTEGLTHVVKEWKHTKAESRCSLT